MDTQIITLLAFGVLPAAASIMTLIVQNRNANTRAVSDHAHELRRDQLAKYYEFRLQEYRERNEACQALLQAVHQMAVMAGTWGRANEMQAKPSTAQTKAAVEAENAVFEKSYELAMTHRNEALKILSVDERAAPVVEAFLALPYKQLLDSPRDEDIKQAWADAAAQLQQAVFSYLDALREGLAPPPAK